MSHKAHPDCPSCMCLRPDEGEEMRVYVNGILMHPGERRTIGLHDRIEYMFVKATRPREAE